MSEPVDLYDSHYGNVEAGIYRKVRANTYGQDLGQTSWMTAPECDEFCGWLGLKAKQKLLEIASGSGGTAKYIAQKHKLLVTGIDINAAAVGSASSQPFDGTRFQVADADKTLPFADEQFDAAFCNDSFNHLSDRPRALADCRRVLRQGGRFLYTDPTVVTGTLSNEEIAVRSSIGFYLFTPPGKNEAMIQEAGFRVVLTADVTHSVAATARRWHDARSDHTGDLVELEGDQKFSELQCFLKMVYTLAEERRLSRFAFVCEKE